ncbi:S1/P1 nuclease [bacterium]|nr:S1/P1 nuclease [bacterium]
MIRTPLIAYALLLPLCSSAVPTIVHAWGCDGHQTVALIASQQLGDRAAKQVDKLLRNYPIDPSLTRVCKPQGLTRFADASSWADDVRNTPRFAHTASWHFLDIPRGASRDQMMTFCPDSGCVTEAITAQIAVLKSNAKGKKKADALRFLIHFVGDIHQPLHCTTNGDRGGNCVPVAFFGRNPSVTTAGKATPNLHSVWDSGLIERNPANTNPKAFADHLRQQFQSKMGTWRAGAIHVDDWAWESHELADGTAYGQLPTAIPVEPDRGELKRCVVHGDNISERMLGFHEHLAQPYQDVAQPVIEEQLAKGGTRLAMILNDVWP